MALLMLLMLPHPLSTTDRLVLESIEQQQGDHTTLCRNSYVQCAMCMCLVSRYELFRTDGITCCLHLRTAKSNYDIVLRGDNDGEMVSGRRRRLVAHT